MLLNSGAIGMFIDRNIVARYRFQLQKLERLVQVRNVNDTNNSTGAITHQVEVNMYYKGYVERMRIDVCDLGKTDVILGMPWLQAYNPEINWKIGEVKITRYLPLWKEYEAERREESKKSKKSGNNRRREDCEIDSK